MIKTRGRKIIRDVIARKGRTALVSLAIFIGVTGVIVFCTMSFVLTAQLNEDLQQDEMVMLETFLGINQGDIPDDEAYLADLAEVEGVTEIDAAFALQGAQFKTSRNGDLSKGSVYGFSTPLEDGLNIEPMRLLDGEYPTENANEIVVEKRMAERFDLKIGDKLYIRVLSPSRAGADLLEVNTLSRVGLFEAWTVSGIVFHPYAGASGTIQDNPNVSIYARGEDALYIGGASGYNAYRARFDSVAMAEKQEDTFKSYLSDNTPYKVVFSTVSDPEQNQLITGAQILTGLLSFIAILALLASGFVVINVISSIVVEQKRQIGIMKTLGASQFDNFMIYAGIALVYGLIGVIPALIIGIPLGSFASYKFAPIVNTVLEGFQISIPAILIGVGLGLFIPVASSIIPVFFGTRVKVLDAITDLGISNRYGAGMISGPLAKAIAVLPLPITMRQGVSNVSMKPIRLLLTGITLAVAVGSFIGIYGLLDSIQEGFGSFLDLFNIEIGIAFTELRDPEELELYIAEDFQTEENNLIVSVESAGGLQMEFVDYAPEASAGGPPGILGYGYEVGTENPAFNFTVDEGETLTLDSPENGIIITRSLADGLEAGVGDVVQLKFSGGPADAIILGIVDYPIDLVFMNWRFLSSEAGFVEGIPTPDREYFTAVNVDDGSVPVPAMGLTVSFAERMEYVDGGPFTTTEPTVIVTEALAEKNNYAVGDTIQLSAMQGDGVEDYTISGIFRIPQEFMDAAAEQGATFIPEDLLGIFWRNLADLEQLEGEPLPQLYFLTTTLNNPTSEEVDKIAVQIEESLLERGLTVQVINFVEFENQFNTIISQIRQILSLAVVMIALVGALGLFISLSMSVFERQKEIGVMRSIGGGAWTVALQFLTEGIIIGFISWLIGLPIALVVQYILLTVTDLMDTFGFNFSWEGAFVALAAVTIITTVASLWPSYAAARKTVSEILRYQ